MAWWIAKAETPYQQLQQTVTGDYLEAFTVVTSGSVDTAQFISTVYPVNGELITDYTTTTTNITVHKTTAAILTGVFSVVFLAAAAFSFHLYRKDKAAEADEHNGGLLETEGGEDRDLN